jgi:hypothetical protein
MLLGGKARELEVSDQQGTIVVSVELLDTQLLMWCAPSAGEAARMTGRKIRPVVNILMMSRSCLLSERNGLSVRHPPADSER